LRHGVRETDDREPATLIVVLTHISVWAERRR
jgi:hypothetical protein